MTLLTSSAPWKPKKYIGSCSILSAQKGNWVRCFSKFSLWWSEGWVRGGVRGGMRGGVRGGVRGGMRGGMCDRQDGEKGEG